MLEDNKILEIEDPIKMFISNELLVLSQISRKLDLANYLHSYTITIWAAARDLIFFGMVTEAIIECVKNCNLCQQEPTCEVGDDPKYLMADGLSDWSMFSDKRMCKYHAPIRKLFEQYINEYEFDEYDIASENPNLKLALEEIIEAL